MQKVDSCDDGRELFRISCLKDQSEVVKVSVDDRKKIWKEHIEKLTNVEN